MIKKTLGVASQNTKTRRAVCDITQACTAGLPLWPFPWLAFKPYPLRHGDGANIQGLLELYIHMVNHGRIILASSHSFSRWCLLLRLGFLGFINAKLVKKEIKTNKILFFWKNISTFADDLIWKWLLTSRSTKRCVGFQHDEPSDFLAWAQGNIQWAMG